MASLFNNTIGFGKGIFIVFLLWGVFIFMLHNLKKHCDDVGVKVVTFLGAIELLYVAHLMNFIQDGNIPGYLCGGVLAMMILGTILGTFVVIIAGFAQWFMLADAGVFTAGVSFTSGIFAFIGTGMVVIFIGIFLNYLFYQPTHKRADQFMWIVGLTCISTAYMLLIHEFAIFVLDDPNIQRVAFSKFMSIVVGYGLLEGILTALLYFAANAKCEPELIFVKSNTTRTRGLR